MVITEPSFVLEEWHNLPSPPPTFHPERAKVSRGSVNNSQSSASLSATLVSQEKSDGEIRSGQIDFACDGESKSAHATDVNVIAHYFGVELQ
jgi:hypothetical protein